MNTEAADPSSDVLSPNPTVAAAMVPSTEIAGLPVTQEVFEEARAGAEKLLKMPPAELRDLIASRVKLLDTELKEREARRAAIDEALAAQRLLAVRRRRARKMRKRVNIGSSLVAAMFTGLVVVSMF
jgi:hypothetical protein